MLALIAYFHQERNQAIHLVDGETFEGFHDRGHGARSSSRALRKACSKSSYPFGDRHRYPRDDRCLGEKARRTVSSKERSSELMVIVQDLTERLLGMEPGTFPDKGRAVASRTMPRTN